MSGRFVCPECGAEVSASSITVELRREPLGDRWCFGCRKRLPHTDVLLEHVEPSYAEPWWQRECSGCGKDRTHFPGCGPL